MLYLEKNDGLISTLCENADVLQLLALIVIPLTKKQKNKPKRNLYIP